MAILINPPGALFGRGPVGFIGKSPYYTKRRFPPRPWGVSLMAATVTIFNNKHLIVSVQTPPHCKKTNSVSTNCNN